jgi:hypothetical protein
MTPLWLDHELLPIGYFRGHTGTRFFWEMLPIFHRQENRRLSQLNTHSVGSADHRHHIDP